MKLTSSGHGLLSGSKLVLGLKPGSAPDCGSLMLTANGRTVVCGAALAADAGSTRSCSAATGLARPGIAEYSTATGRLTSVLYQYTGACIAGQADVLWASPSGGAVLGYLGITQQFTRAIPRWEVPGRPIHRRLIQAAAHQAGRRDAYGRNDRLLVTIAF